MEFVQPIKMGVVNQRQLGLHTRCVAYALRAALCEDPDVIMVGEPRDLETNSLASTCAELGILVFGTLHANSAVKSIDRIINAFPASQQNQMRSMLSESLKGVLAQQLIKTADGKGRCAAVEIVISNAGVSNLIREGKLVQVASLIYTGAAEGMQTMDQALQRLVDQKHITPEDAYWKALDKESFASRCKESMFA